MPTWKDVPDEIKSRFRTPPDRDNFSSIVEYEKALGGWHHSVGRNLGLAMQQYEYKKRLAADRSSSEEVEAS